MKLCYKVLMAAVLMTVAEAQAITVTLQPGPEGKDTWIWDGEDFSHADWGELRANMTSAFDQRILVEFDLSSIPAGAIINSASLGLYKYDGYSGGTLTLDAHQITSPWAESVTYSTAPGFNGAAESSATITGALGFYTWDLTGLTQGWVDGSVANNGVGVYDHGTDFYQRFVSSDNAGATDPSWALPPTDPALRPYLKIDYTPRSTHVPDAAATLPLLALSASLLALFGRKIRQQGESA